jgi:hypothetical protein
MFCMGMFFCIWKKNYKKQLAFFMNPSRLSWKINSWLSDEIFNAIHLIFTGYGTSTLHSTTFTLSMQFDSRNDIRNQCIRLMDEEMR